MANIKIHQENIVAALKQARSIIIPRFLQSSLLFRLLQNWLFQGAVLMHWTELVFRAGLEIAIVVGLACLFSMFTHYAIVWAVLVTHTFMWTFNGSFWALKISNHARLVRNTPERIERYIAGLQDRMENTQSITACILSGSLTQGRFHQYSDLDIWFTRRKGFAHGLWAFTLGVRERSIAFLWRIPIELYFFDPDDYVGRDKGEPLLLLKDVEERWKGVAPSSTCLQDYPLNEMDFFAINKKTDPLQSIKIFSLTKGFHGGVARYVAMVSELNEREDIDLHTVVLNNPASLCNREDIDTYGLDEIEYHGPKDFSWIEPCLERIDRFKPDLLFVHGASLAGNMARILQRKLKSPLPYVISNHGYYLPSPSEKRSLRKYYHTFLAWLTPWVYQRKAFAVVTVAEHCKQYFISHGVDAEKITVVHNGIPAERPNCAPIARSSLSLNDDSIVIGTVSRMEPEKGLDYLLDAVANIAEKNPRVHLVVVGGGRCYQQLQQQSRELGIESRVHLFEYQDNTEAWLDLFDIYALPSLREGHSIALLEAMRAGKAIVASSVPGNKESVDDEKEALLVPPKDAQALAQALDRLAGDRTLAKELSEAAKERFHRCFTVERMLDETAVWLSDCARLARMKQGLVR